MARSGEIPGTKIGRKWRFKKSQIDCWLEDNAATARKDATK
jgi:excisionase family DNA binding protein